MNNLLFVVTFMRLIRRYGGLGLLALGIIDSTVIPLPGSTDVLTLILSNHQRMMWPYYAASATVGSVIGGFLTYRVAKKGGQEALEKGFSRRKTRRIYALFDKWGFGAIFIPAFLPPPIPFVPFLVTAGALNYPAKKFLIALTLGRSIRFSVLAYLAARYGPTILRFLRHEYNTILIVFILAALAIGAGFAVYFSLKRDAGRVPPHKEIRGR